MGSNKLWSLSRVCGRLACGCNVGKSFILVLSVSEVKRDRKSVV